MMKTLAIALTLLALPVLAKDIQLTVKAMDCGGCATSIQEKFKTEASVSKVDVDLETKVVKLTVKDGSSLPKDKLKQLMKDAGFPIEDKDIKGL